MLTRTNPLEALNNNASKNPTMGKIIASVYSDVQDTLDSVINKINVTYSIDCGEIVRDALKKSKKRIETKNASSGVFYKIFGSIPVEGTEVSVEDVLDKTNGRIFLNRKILKRWEEGRIPFGCGSSAIVSFQKRTPERGAFYRLEVYIEKRF